MIVSHLRYFLLFLLLLGFNRVCSAQASESWIKRYNGSLNLGDSPAKIKVDRSNNIVICGTTNSQTNRDIVVIKYNPAGDTLWVRTYGFSTSPFSQDFARNMVLDDSNNVYVIGGIENFGGPCFLTIRYSSSGVLQWVKRFTLPFYALANDIIFDGGFVYVTGEHLPQSNFPAISYTLKYNSFTGDTAWVRKFGGFNFYHGYAKRLAKDGSGNIYLGVEGTRSAIPRQIGLIKYNSNGDSLFVRFYDSTGANADLFVDMKRDEQGNIFFTGQRNVNALDIITMKINPAGNMDWVKRFGNQFFDDNSSSLLPDNNGGVYIVGYTYTSSFSLRDFLTIKYNSNGDTAWTRKYDSPIHYSDNAFDIAADNLGNTYVTGTGSVTTLRVEFITIKYNSVGAQLWIKNYMGASTVNEIPISMALDTSRNVYVTGSSQNTSNSDDYDILTVKYSQTITELSSNSSSIPRQFMLYQNYPNPFNPSTMIKFDLTQKSFVKLILLDITGKEIAELINETLNAGYHTVEFDGANFASGVYFYRIIVEGEGKSSGGH